MIEINFVFGHIICAGIVLAYSLMVALDA